MASAAPSEAKALSVAPTRAGEVFFADGFVGAQADQQHALGGDAGHAAQQQGGAGLAGDVAGLEGGGDVAVAVEGFGRLRQLLVFEHRRPRRQPVLAAARVFFVSNAFMLKSI